MERTGSLTQGHRKSMSFEIEYSPDAVDHLRMLSKRDQKRVVDQVELHLTHQPMLATRNRKKLRPNLLADWELRVGQLRVYYVVRESPTPLVSIIAIGKKVGNRVFIGCNEVTL